VAHPSLRILNFNGLWIDRYDDVETHDVAGAALGALVAANAPALTQLDVSESNLWDEGLRPLMRALRTNTHLRKLDICDNNTKLAMTFHAAACGACQHVAAQANRGEAVRGNAAGSGDCEQPCGGGSRLARR
jgi:hypothetical protein